MLRPTSLMAMWLLLTPAILAHEGHGDPTHQHGVMHYVVNPAHAIPMLLTVVAGGALWFLVRLIRRSQR